MQAFTAAFAALLAPIVPYYGLIAQALWTLAGLWLIVWFLTARLWVTLHLGPVRSKITLEFGLLRHVIEGESRIVATKMGETLATAARLPVKRAVDKARAVTRTLRSPGFFGAVLDTLADTLKAYRFEQARFELWVGFEDPATTGWFLGGLSILSPTLGFLGEQVKIDIMPDYHQPRLSIEGQGKMSTSLAELLWVLIKILFRKSLWKGFEVYRLSVRIIKSPRPAKA